MKSAIGRPSSKTVIAIIILVICLSAGFFIWRAFYEGKGKGIMPVINKPDNIRIIYVGMDGLDPELLVRFMDRGHLPNFKRLAAEGSFMPLITSNPPQSPVAWTSMATGKNPGKHGIFDFIHRDLNYGLHLSLLKENNDAMSLLTGTNYARPYNEKTFWEHLAEVGIPTTVIRWPVTFPAPEDGKYKLLAGLGVPDINGLLGRYTFFYTDKNLDLQDKSGRYVLLEYGNVINTHLEGGRGAFGSPLNVPLSILIDTTGNKLEINVQNNRWAGSAGEWSPWMPVKFKAGFIKSIPAICKFYVVSVVPDLRLYMTSIQFDPSNPYFPISTPHNFSKEIVEELGMYFPTLGMPEDTKAMMEGALDEKSFLEQCYQTLDVQEKVLMKELKVFREGVLAVVFDTPDRIQHMFWQGIKNKGDLKADNPILQVYKYMDNLVGKILPYVDHDTILIISSDHGFTDFDFAINMNTFLLKEGFLKLKQGATGAERNGLLQAVDWSQTKAYAVGFNSIYLNLTGREKRGIVNSSEAPRLTGEIITALKGLNDEGRHIFPVANVYKKEDIYSGEYLLNAPDMVVGLRSGYRFSWQTALGGIPEGEIFSTNDKKWSGDHCIDYILVPGIILSNKKIKKESPGIMDIAATLLKHAGLSLEGLDGESLF